MTTIYNLADNREMTFGDDVSPLWAVAHAWCEDNQRLSWLYKAEEDNRLLDYACHLPIQVGLNTIACGDWCANGGLA